MCLGGIDDEREFCLLRHAGKFSHVRDVPVKEHDDDRFRSRTDLRKDRCRADEVRFRIDVDEPRIGPRHQDRFSRRDEGVRGNDDLISGADAQRAQRQGDRVGSIPHADTVGTIAIPGPGRLEDLHLLAADELGAFECSVPDVVQTQSDVAVHGGQVHQGNAGIRRSFVSHHGAVVCQS